MSDEPSVPPGSGTKWEQVVSITREEEARLLAGRLEAEGIPARLSPESQHSFYAPEVVGKRIDIFVPEHLVAEARAVIESLGLG